MFYYHRESNDRNVLSQSAGIGHSGGEVLPYKRPNGDAPLDGVAFSMELLEWGRKFSDIWG